MQFILSYQNILNKYNLLLAREDILVKQIEETEKNGKDPRPFFPELKTVINERVELFTQLNFIPGGN